MIARERNNNKQNNGKRFHYCIIDTQKYSVGVCFKNGEVRFGKAVLCELQDRKRLRQEVDDETI